MGLSLSLCLSRKDKNQINDIQMITSACELKTEN